MKSLALLASVIVLMFGFVVGASTENHEKREAGKCNRPGQREWDWCGNPCFCSDDLVFLCEDVPC
ncbi:hypothetical protein TSAR_016310 [Trichomalopsis sarcophagae]|uniref:Pacifastin domain-containing protein n=1 Tax=Trichomalopsis sarcophagae TaxID=543379 RepID=A0A232FBR9_9HYME|nr:hypothetical protein TSAR_016310 [Trichomalopsis sarcophagae]